MSAQPTRRSLRIKQTTLVAQQFPVECITRPKDAEEGFEDIMGDKDVPSDGSDIEYDASGEFFSDEVKVIEECSSDDDSEEQDSDNSFIVEDGVGESDDETDEDMRSSDPSCQQDKKDSTDNFAVTVGFSPKKKKKICAIVEDEDSDQEIDNSCTIDIVPTLDGDDVPSKESVNVPREKINSRKRNASNADCEGESISNAVRENGTRKQKSTATAPDFRVQDVDGKENQVPTEMQERVQANQLNADKLKVQPELRVQVTSVRSKRRKGKQNSEAVNSDSQKTVETETSAVVSVRSKLRKREHNSDKVNSDVQKNTGTETSALPSQQKKSKRKKRELKFKDVASVVSVQVIGAKENKVASLQSKRRKGEQNSEAVNSDSQKTVGTETSDVHAQQNKNKRKKRKRILKDFTSLVTAQAVGTKENQVMSVRLKGTNVKQNNETVNSHSQKTVGTETSVRPAQITKRKWKKLQRVAASD